MNGEAVGGRWNEGAHVRCAFGRTKASIRQGGASCAGRAQAPELKADPPVTSLSSLLPNPRTGGSPALTPSRSRLGESVSGGVLTRPRHNQWRTFTNFGVARMPTPLFLGRFSVKRTENFFALRAKDTTRYYKILQDTMRYCEIL